jgi:hypothetical protein
LTHAGLAQPRTRDTGVERDLWPYPPCPARWRTEVCEEVTTMKLPRWLSRLRRARNVCPECGTLGHDAFCEVCGYELVRDTRTELKRYTPPL